MLATTKTISVIVLCTVIWNTTSSQSRTSAPGSDVSSTGQEVIENPNQVNGISAGEHDGQGLST